jgi:hypothetical protein
VLISLSRVSRDQLVGFRADDAAVDPRLRGEFAVCRGLISSWEVEVLLVNPLPDGVKYFIVDVTAEVLVFE